MNCPYMLVEPRRYARDSRAERECNSLVSHHVDAHHFGRHLSCGSKSSRARAGALQPREETISNDDQPDSRIELRRLVVIWRIPAVRLRTPTTALLTYISLSRASASADKCRGCASPKSHQNPMIPATIPPPPGLRRNHAEFLLRIADA